MGAVKSTASLRVETHVREDAISLYGFIDTDEQDWFRLLTTVQGVGAKAALAILGTLPLDQLAPIIAAQDKSALTHADGVGPKLALRLVTELKDKIPAFMARPVARHGPIAGASDVLSSPSNDAVSALINLGYRRAEAFTAVANVSLETVDAKLDELIRLSLAKLSRKDDAA
jgi:Holliday junction DNA helicase RuvA